MGAHCINEDFCLLHHFAGIIEFNGVTLVIRDKANFFCTLQEASQFFGDRTVFDEMQAKCSDQTAVSLANVGLHWRTRRQQRCASGIEHGVVSPVASAIDIVQVE